MWPFMFRSESQKQRKLQKQVADLEATVEARDRIIRILEAERDSLAACVARDRARVQAEGASYSRQQAEHEHNGRTDASIQ